MQLTLIFLVVVLGLSLTILAHRLERTRDDMKDWETVFNALRSRIHDVEQLNNELLSDLRNTQKNLGVTALVVEQDHAFIEAVKSTAKESTRASAARIAALQNRNLR